MKLTKEEIQKRHEEVSGKLVHLSRRPKRTQYHNWASDVAKLEGELFGLSWVLQFWENGYYETERIQSTTEVQD